MSYRGDDYYDQLRSLLPDIPIERIRHSIENIHDNFKKGISAKEMSLNKWVKIKESLEKILYNKESFGNILYMNRSFGYHTCAYCVESTDKYRTKFGEVKVNTDKCIECPLSKIDCCPKEDSIFNKFLKDYSNLRFYDYSAENMDLLQEIIEDVQLMISNIEIS